MHFEVDDCASILDVIRVADVKIKERCGKFPVREFTSLFQMVYYLHEERFYRQVAVQAHARQNQFLNIRENPRMSLPDEATIILIPEADVPLIGRNQSNEDGKEAKAKATFSCTQRLFL